MLSLWKQCRESWVGWQSWWHPANWCKFGQRICCFNCFQFTVKGEERSKSKTSCIRQETEKISMNGKLTRPSEERERLSKNCMKLRLKLRREIGRREILTSLFVRSIKSLNLNDFSYIKQVDGQIRLRERERGTKSAFMEHWNWEIDYSTKIMQQIAKKLKNWEEIVAKKQIEQDKQELMSCVCINRGIPRQCLNCRLRFRNYRTK